MIVAADAEMWIPGRLPSLNDLLAGGRKHNRAVYSNFKRAQTEAIAAIARTSLCRFDEGAHIHAHFFEPNRKRDPDNFASVGVKFILDGLTVAGILPNDGWKQVKSLKLSWSVSKERPGIMVRLS